MAVAAAAADAVCLNQQQQTQAPPAQSNTQPRQQVEAPVSAPAAQEVAPPKPQPPAALPQPQQQQQAGNNQIQNDLYNKENALGEAERDHNSEFFAQNLAPDFLYVAFNGLVLTKDKLMEAMQHAQISSYEIRNVKFRPLSGDTVQLAYDLFVEGAFGPLPVPHQMYATSIWMKCGNDWRLVYHQTTPARHH